MRYSARGYPYRVWKKPVPRISDDILDSVVYLYPSVTDAEAGEKAGGTGFLVGVPSGVHEGVTYQYAVTNSHVIREGNSPVIRLNTQDGATDVLKLSKDDWVDHQYGDDLAVCPLEFSLDTHKFSLLTTDEWFLTKEEMEKYDIGPGDDVFMVGRFIQHEGRQRNTPVVRFGNISMMPWEPVTNMRGIKQESFLVEMRSLSGFSGSPVFVHIPPLALRPGKESLEVTSYFWLLGVDWGNFSIDEEVREGRGSKDPVKEGWVVRSSSGQALVVPTWRLQELLNREELAMARERKDGEIRREQERGGAVFDVHTEDAKKPGQSETGSDTFTEDDFEDALDRVSRRESTTDQES